jgi:hypothetical protein
MKSSNIWVAMLVVCLFVAPAALAQQEAGSLNQTNSSAAPSDSTAVVPQLIKFNGTLLDADERPMTGMTGVTFALYSEQTGGASLWMETQNVKPDANGNYTVLLGAASKGGVPAELFATGETRWLGIQVEQRPELPRVVLVSVPYALKAADAQTLGGLPSSAFVLAGAASAAASQTTVSTGDPGNLAAGNTSAANPLTIGGSGAPGRIPLWTTSTNLGNSALFQTGTGTTARVGLGTTTPGAPLDVHGTINSSAGFNLGGKPFAFGSYSNENAFLGFAGNTTTTGSDNTATGYEALLHNTTGSDNTASGRIALYSNTTGYSNTATGYEALLDNTTGDENTANGLGSLGHNTTGSSNTASGAFALNENTTGSNNTADGYDALLNNTTTGRSNTATGYGALLNNTTGSDNTASGADALSNNSTGNYNTALGFGAGPDPSTHALTNSTAIGAFADVTESYALVLGSSAAFNGVANVSVGIDVTNPTNILTVLQGGGPAIADGWNTYSSRRWKTNIHPVENALSKVERLRGVSYDLKDSGKHEIGVIAEEVGQVVPEVVSYEQNGKDATGVDYSRLTALLIEAVKQQQREIRDLKSELREIRDLKSELRTTRQTLQKVQAQVAGTQPTLVAAK